MDSTQQETRIDRRLKRRRFRRRRITIVFLLTLVLVIGGALTRYHAPISSAFAKSAAEPHMPQPEGESPPPQHSPTASMSPMAQPSSPQPVEQGAGSFTLVPGSGALAGNEHGQLYTYQVQVEDGTEQDGAVFAHEVETTLHDSRSWVAAGDVAFQRVDSANPSFVLYLASPRTVDALCAPLDTAGYTSCRVGDKVVINLARWLLAVPEYGDSLPEYRQYVINHEVGHRLGHEHENCPGAGQSAPVMQQQTYGLQGCTMNPWPYP